MAGSFATQLVALGFRVEPGGGTVIVAVSTSLCGSAGGGSAAKAILTTLPRSASSATWRPPPHPAEKVGARTGGNQLPAPRWTSPALCARIKSISCQR
jgi:hypothetical protein